MRSRFSLSCCVFPLCHSHSHHTHCLSGPRLKLASLAGILDNAGCHTGTVGVRVLCKWANHT